MYPTSSVFLSAGGCLTLNPSERRSIHHDMLGNVVNYLLPPSGLELLQGIVGRFLQVDRPEGAILLSAGSDKESGSL